MRNPAKAKLKAVFNQPSWRIASTDVEAFVTQTGGHLGPVIFDRHNRRIAPFSVAPWATEPLSKNLPAVLRALRGDFFCMPFGGNATPFRGERHPVHGETANAQWKFESTTSGRGENTLHLSLRTQVRSARVDKTITLHDGHPAVYVRHLISEMTGPMSLGHHAMLKFPDSPESGVISTSPFVHGQVYPGRFENPAEGGYSALKAGAGFYSLDNVPMANGDVANLSRYPARQGFEDLVTIVSDPSVFPAWTAVVFPKQRYAWFALKDPSVLTCTVFWISNRGRHYAPWNSRHVGVMGLEEVTSAFHDGLAESVKPNPISNKGYATHFQFSAKKPLAVNYIMACASIPAKFDQVSAIEPKSSGDAVILRASSGAAVTIPLDLPFLQFSASGAGR